MGLIVPVYRTANFVRGSFGGVFGSAANLCILNADAPYYPTDDIPAALVESHQPGCICVVPAVQDEHGVWVRKEKQIYMAGFNYAASSDGRFVRLCEKLLGHDFYGAVAIHDMEWK